MGLQADGLFVKLSASADVDWLRREYSLRERDFPADRFFCILSDGGRGEPLDFDDAETSLLSEHLGEAIYLFVYDGAAAENYTFLYEHSVGGEVVRALAYGARGWWHDDDDILWRRVQGESEAWETDLFDESPVEGSDTPALAVDRLYQAVTTYFDLNAEA